VIIHVKSKASINAGLVYILHERDKSQWIGKIFRCLYNIKYLHRNERYDVFHV